MLPLLRSTRCSTRVGARLLPGRSLSTSSPREALNIYVSSSFAPFGLLLELPSFPFSLPFPSLLSAEPELGSNTLTLPLF
jgi:hypothetical protein